jgi:hypothetical protein
MSLSAKRFVVVVTVVEKNSKTGDYDNDHDNDNNNKNIDCQTIFRTDTILAGPLSVMIFQTEVAVRLFFSPSGHRT